MKKINIGIIGCGHWGPNYLRNFSSIAQVNIAWVSDLNPQRLEHIGRLYPKIKTTKDYKKIISDYTVDAVVVATPTVTHYKIARECLLKNKHVLVEKPLATSVKDAQNLLELSREKRKILMVGHTFEYNPGINKIKECIEKDKLGKVYYLYSTRTNLGPLRSDVNALWDLAPHDVSIFSYLLNAQPLRVSAQGAGFLQKGVEDIVFITLYYPQNIIAGIHVSWLNPRKVREITLVGSKRMLVFDDLNGTNPVFLYNKGVIRKPYPLPYYDTFREFKLIIREGSITTPKVERREPLGIACRHFIECIMQKKEPRSGARDGLNVVRVLKAIQDSLKNGGKITEVR
ncbi:MAG: Gfo/Idh/MocA family oxidoreductase [Candidatus Omnitrophica bacterium]|nr:Gfo/Idh/MocA family oxidoreductase [Candidatus Omnitrophota bacterium]MDD5591977.1 Gfo/Idh/MocA family oxidoreductase [Candidatus Omnitrophota bacterium]